MLEQAPVSLPAPSNSDRAPFLIAVLEDARRELLMRVERRDSWLRVALLSQVALFGLASGFEIAGAKPHATPQNILLYAPVIALVLYLMYSIEDRLIGLLGHYVSSLPAIEQELTGGRRAIPVWDSSPQIDQYSDAVLPVRVSAQAATFVVLPAFLLGAAFLANAVRTIVDQIVAVFDVLALMAVAFLIIRWIAFRKGILKTRFRTDAW